MKKICVLLLALLIAFALVGCNIAPNVPRVTPYVTQGAVNPGDKDLLPGIGVRP